MYKSCLNIYASLWLSLLCVSHTHAELVLSAPPRETLEVGSELYGPLAKHLTQLLGEKVTYKHPDNWLHYQRELRNDVYDVVFDGPHFISWRIKNLKHSVLLKLPGSLEFFIITNKSATNIKVLTDLIGKKICAIPPPNLATMIVIDQFKNPARQPDIIPVRGDYKQVAKSFSSGACDAAVFRSTYYNKKLPDDLRSNTHKLFVSMPLPNQGISVSIRVNDENKDKIVQSLTKGEGIDITRDIVKRFGGEKAKSFVIANQNEYIKHVELLEGVVFGW